MTLKEKTEALRRAKAATLEMGGADRVKKQHDAGKLDVRARVALLFDAGTFVEVGALARADGHLASEEVKPSPADGVVCGTGRVEGRLVACAAYDFTVHGGSMGAVGERKVTRLRELALRQRLPIVWLIDSGGARISSEMDPKNLSFFADTGFLFREQVVMSGVVPQVAAMMGPGAAGTAYIPGLADFVPMVKGTSSIAIGGPYLVKSTVGEDVTAEALGGSKIHNELSGVADQEYASDADCLAAIRRYLAFFPSHSGEKPPRTPQAQRTDPASRRAEKLYDLVPAEPRKAYDMRKVLAELVDGGAVFELKPRFARNLVTAFAHLDGWPVGFVANNPMYLGGILDAPSAQKAARFITLCDAFGIPLVFLQDVPGFMVGTKAEQQGIINAGARMLFAVAGATVPKLTVVVRKAYGAGYFAMCGRAYEPDLLVAWPIAEIALMGAEGMVSIAASKALAQAEDPKALQAELAAQLRPFIDVQRVAAQGYVDDVIDPAETRQVLANALALTANKTVERPPKRREVTPM